MVDIMSDDRFMKKALQMAQEALSEGEVPVGAVVVKDGQIIAQARNEKELTGDPTDHAEMLAIKRAVRFLSSWRLSDCTMYVTLEPCPMCAGAMVQARLGRLVFGAYDPKAGAAGSVVDLLDVPWLNHQVPVKSGVLKEECGEILSFFFNDLRK